MADEDVVMLGVVAEVAVDVTEVAIIPAKVTSVVDGGCEEDDA